MSYGRIAVWGLVCIGVFIVSRYARVNQEAGFRIIALPLVSYIYYKTYSVRIGKRAAGSLGVFSLLLGLATVLGYHIHVESVYNGLIDTSYIISFTFLDVISLLFISLVVFVVSKGLYIVVSGGKLRKFFFSEGRTDQIRIKHVLLVALFLMVPYVFYLMIYYPGFVFADSLASVDQAVGIVPLNNHHPILYTLFLKVCFGVSHVIGRGNTFGIAIYSIVQSCYMSLCLSYFINWLHARFSLRWFCCALLMVFFGWTPYVATYSVAVWKDPVFVLSLLCVSLINYDLCIFNSKFSYKKLIGLLLFALLAIFSRNNGIYVIAFTEFIWIIVWIIKKRTSDRKVACGLLAVLIVSYVITGPVYDHFNLNEEKVESVGVFLQQMARTATYEENLDAQDQEYMDRLLEGGTYQDTYHPGCVDLLKWNEHFHSEVLEEDFFAHWLSMGRQYPKRYFEAWEFASAGTWAPNLSIWEQRFNILGGMPINIVENHVKHAESVGIYNYNLLRSDVWRNIFAANEWSAPASWIHWFLLFVIIVIVLNNKKRYLPALAPSVGVIITLLIASPIMYWSRYYLLEQLLFPMYFVMLLHADKAQTE